MALIRTDYGLIYNTDGSLCATLLPEGGVAVTEGTTNLCNPSFIYKNTWTTIDYAWNRRTIIDCSAGDVFTISADIKELSQGADRRWARVSFHDSEGIELEYHNAMGSGMSEQRLSFTTPAAPVGTVEARVYWINNAQGSNPYQGKNFQIEKKPYSTPFTEGTRPAGSLSYDLPISINGDWTIAKWLELEPYFMELTYENNGVWKCPVLSLGTGFGSSGQGLIGLYGAWFTSDAGKTITFVIDKEGDRLNTRKITLNEEEYNDKIFAVIVKQNTTLTAHLFTSADHYTMEYDISSLGDLSVIKPQLYFHANIVPVNQRMYCKRHLNTLVCPYAVSPETIATWYSLDVPFFDPREIATAELAARQYAEAQAELARITAEAYADGRVTAEEQARIADAQQKLQEAKQYADQKAAEDIDATKRTIYAPGVIIDSTGAWGISGGVKQAGFGTDGKWLAGGGSVIADESGLKVFDGKFSLQGPNQTVIIDGTSNMFKIYQTGTATVPAGEQQANGKYGEVIVPFPDLGYRPAFLVYMIGTQSPLIGEAVWPYYTYYQHISSSGKETYYSWGIWASTASDHIRIINYFSWPVDIRYYVLKEEAI